MIRNLRFFVVILLIAAILAACSSSTTVAPTAVPPTPTSPTPTPANTSTSPPQTRTATPNPVPGTVALVKGWFAAFAAHNPDQIVSFYSKDIQEYDATFASNSYMNYSAIDGFYHVEYMTGSFNLNPDSSKTSFFVSDDGRFVATLSIWTDVEGSKPDVSLLEFKDGKIIWQYDYYGRMPANTSDLQTIPASANQPAPANLVDQTRATIMQWQAAYNSRNAQAYLSSYADQAEYTDATSAQWRVLSRTGLEKEIAASFTDPEFKSKLDTFFVSANGRYAAVQGVYKDAKTVDIPMVVILEIENGKIINQHNYLLLPIPAANATPVSQAEGIVNGLIAAYRAGDPEKLVACYSQGVRI
ncbi:MAG TPA: nuclear transport factor 2 family protein [Anaerolineaceae bacterium]|nr:nuclear transport factor 2 family protein [Anaerolineaceae bacterium]